MNTVECHNSVRASLDAAPSGFELSDNADAM